MSSSPRSQTSLSDEERHEILAGRHILVVDDDELARRALVRLLGIEGCRVSTAANLAEARALNQGQVVYDAAIIDYWLAGQDGPETGPALVRWLRSAPAPCCALLITGSRSSAIGLEAIAAGAEDFLIKPFAPPDLLDSLARTVARTLAWRHRLALSDYLAQPEPQKRQALSSAANAQRPPRSLEDALRLPPGSDLGGALETLVKEGHLSEQQREVLRHLLSGASMREIGEAFAISPRTVKYHAAIIYERLGVSNKSELLTMLLERFVPTQR